jgi:putative ABC transport system permease protein
MTVTGIGMRNIWRKKARTILTIAAGAFFILFFILLRTILWAWSVQAEYAAQDRLATRHKVSFILPLPKRYVDTVREMPGVTKATWANWFGGKDPKRPDEFFATLAVDPPSFLEVYTEAVVSPDDRARWFADRRGAIIGDVLARKMGVKVGDKVILAGTIFPGDWEFNIDGIYQATAKSIDRSQLLFHWNYLNESVPDRRKDQVGWIISRIDHPESSANITAAIDKIFDEKDVQTASMSEHALQNSFMASFSAILKAIDIISMVIMLISMMILGNTIAMSVRERTREYGVLRALGFTPGHVRTFIMGEALAIGFLSGAIGLLVSYPLVQFVLSPVLEENMGAWFPYFRVNAFTACLAVVLSVVLAAIASLIPAQQAARLSIIDALRRVG